MLSRLVPTGGGVAWRGGRRCQPSPSPSGVHLGRPADYRFESL